MIGPRIVRLKADATRTVDGPGQLTRILSGRSTAFNSSSQWWREKRLKRRDVAVTLFRHLDPAGVPLPEPIEKRRAAGGWSCITILCARLIRPHSYLSIDRFLNK
jgi:hypothetical protein